MLAELLDQLTGPNGPTNLTALARAADLSRGTLDNIVDGTTDEPRASTLAAIEKAAEFPPGTIADYLAHDITLEEAVSRYRTYRPDEDRTPESRSTEWRLARLEEAVDRILEQVERLQREVEALLRDG